MKRIILGSTSPRRKDVFSNLGLNYSTISPPYEEEFNNSLSLLDDVQRISNEKLSSILQSDSNSKRNYIFTADTVVCIDGLKLGKPKDRPDAATMLRLLSNKEHLVCTSMSLYNPTKEIIRTNSVTTRVFFKELSDRDIHFYLDKNEWKDAAGAYKIQGIGEILIDKIIGSFSNVMGLPIGTLYDMLMDENYFE